MKKNLETKHVIGIPLAKKEAYYSRYDIRLKVEQFMVVMVGLGVNQYVSRKMIGRLLHMSAGAVDNTIKTIMFFQELFGCDERYKLVFKQRGKGTYFAIKCKTREHLPYKLNYAEYIDGYYGPKRSF